MKNYKNILFDVDGTLMDSKDGIINSLKMTLRFFGIRTPYKEKLYKFIGMPLDELLLKYYEFDEKDAKRAMSKYREYYKSKGMFESTLYDSIPELLENLMNAGKNLIIATSKEETSTNQMLENLGIKDYFNFVCGSTIDGLRTKKTEVIKHILLTQNLDIDSTIMVGDRDYDIIGAKEANIDSIGVLYGYGNYEELQNAGATFIVNDVKELQKQLLGE